MFGTSIDVMDLVNISGLTACSLEGAQQTRLENDCKCPTTKKVVDIDDKTFGMEDLSIEMWTVHIM